MSLFARKLIRQLMYAKGLLSGTGRVRLYVPPGHFYSPIPSLAVVKQHEARIFGRIPESIPGIDLNEKEQLALLEAFAPYYPEIPFEDEPKNGMRYFFRNGAYSYSDAIFLYCMIRHLRPKRVIEVGSGYSSCAILDTNELFFGNKIKCTFIDPHPELLLSLVKEEDRGGIEVVRQGLQDVDPGRFAELTDGDILFIDSTHVSKVDSDVNRALFEILPGLGSGVHIHFHDVFYPFEYPKEWVYEGRAWNEAYLLRAFLQYNSAFEIVFWNHFMFQAHRNELLANMPLAGRNPGGSLWIRKN